jgi:lipid-binding SYLF domain-containing protein
MPRLLVLFCLLPGCLLAASADERRLRTAARVFEEVMSSADRAIPQRLLARARCVVIVPGLKKAAFLLGARYGRGFVTCRNPDGPGWTAPAAIRIEGGSFGLQFGGKESDLVLLIMNERGLERLLASRFTLGGQVSVSAGPVGRSAAAETDALMTAEILSWARSRGVFAGVSLEGASLRQDVAVNRNLYGRVLDNREILTMPPVAPAAAQPLLDALNRHSGGQ